MEEVNNTIDELENSDTTFSNCEKLAILYIIRDHHENVRNPAGNDEVTVELSDILPQYHKYVDIKREYQLGNISETAVETAIKKVCKEIQEFIHTMYICTDMPSERTYIKEMLTKLSDML